jgi:two-component system nitrogen regulation sensor histidine kinase NtrY
MVVEASGSMATGRQEAAQRRPGRWFALSERGTGVLGPIVGVLAMATALVTFLILIGITPIIPTPRVVLIMLGLNVVMILLLLVFVAAEVFVLVRARRQGTAGSRLHVRFVGLFSAIAVLPVVLVAVVGLVTLDRGLDPWFSGSLRQLVSNAGVFAREYQQQLCQNIGRESQLMATDIERIRADGLYERDHDAFAQFMTSRALSLGFPYAVLIHRNGMVIDKASIRSSLDLPPPGAQDFGTAETDEPPCLISARAIASLRKVKGFDDAYLYVARPVSPQAVQFPALAQAGIQQYEALEANRETTQLVIGAVFALITLIVLLSAILIGLRFANQLVQPIRRLIQATDQVSYGNLLVQVPVQRSDGDLGHLGSTFNKMTAELRSQHNRLLAANDLIDRRRRFMEAVLSGVPAAVVGLDDAGRITLVNPPAEQLLGGNRQDLAGKPIVDLLPELEALVKEAASAQQRLVHEEINLSLGGKDRILSVRVTSEQVASGRRGYVVTLDDITDLVTAQRTSAWADVARRIAHEIKNPLTPIQLSAERIRRRYGKVIGEDREVFDQCTDTIIRQVEDIKKMVDEFSSFARMPKPTPARDDLRDALRQLLFMMRVGYPDITFEDKLPEEAVVLDFDRRLVGQAVQNILKNATEGIAALPQGERGQGVVSLGLDLSQPGRLTIDVIDNGKGLPSENRHRLLEPYTTTRASGTGLGLPIVAKIFEEHGGGIELLDAPSVAEGGHGARIRLWLPFQPPDAPARKQQPEITANSQSESKIS